MLGVVVARAVLVEAVEVAAVFAIERVREPEREHAVEELLLEARAPTKRALPRSFVFRGHRRRSVFRRERVGGTMHG